MIKAQCIEKVRNNKGLIIEYTLRDQQGNLKQVTPQQLKYAIANNQIEITNLQIDKLGRLVDKAEERNRNTSEKLKANFDVLCKYIYSKSFTMVLISKNHKNYDKIRNSKNLSEVSQLIGNEPYMYHWDKGLTDDYIIIIKGLPTEGSYIHDKNKFDKIVNDAITFSKSNINTEYIGSNNNYWVKITSKSVLQVKQTVNKKMYTMQDLINHIDPTGYTVKVFDIDTQKELITEGDGLWNTGESDAEYNIIYVYSKELGKQFSARLGNREAKTYLESCLSREKIHSGKYKVAICINSNNGYKVDVKPNPNGKYTVLKIGKYTYEVSEVPEVLQQFYSDETIKSEKYFIRNNETSEKKWVNDLSIDTHNNEYTNAGLEKGEQIFDKEVAVIDYNKQYRKECMIEDKLSKLFEYTVKHSCISLYEDESIKEVSYFRDDELRKWVESIEKLEKAYNTLQLYRSFEQFVYGVLRDTLDRLIENEETYYVKVFNEEISTYSSDISYVQSAAKEYINMYLEGEYEIDDVRSEISSNIDIESMIAKAEMEQLHN